MDNNFKIYRKLMGDKTLNWNRISITNFDNRPFNPATFLMKIVKDEQNMSDPLIITQKYKDFDGRIITNEMIKHGTKLYDICVQWDCGATYCNISKELVKRLNIAPVKNDKVTTCSSSKIVNVYNIDLILNNDIFIPVEASEANNIHDTGIDLLIGMDVICRGDFAISTYNGETCFSFRIPSNGHIIFD